MSCYVALFLFPFDRVFWLSRSSFTCHTVDRESIKGHPAFQRSRMLTARIISLWLRPCTSTFYARRYCHSSIELVIILRRDSPPRTHPAPWPGSIALAPCPAALAHFPAQAARSKGEWFRLPAALLYVSAAMVDGLQSSWRAAPELDSSSPRGARSRLARIEQWS